VSRCALFRRLAEAERVVQISALAGSGKTVLVRSWIAGADLAARATQVPVGREERDPRRFWVGVVDALRGTAAGAALVRPLTAAPELDGWAVVERLLTDLAPLAERLWLVIDDAHDLGPGEVLAQLELLVLRAPPELPFVLATRHDLRLGLHRLRLAGELTELRADDLRFSVAEARALFGAAGVRLPEEALAQLHERTEGWAAGLRLAALSLAGDADPDRFAAEFSGSERTVADYLLAEVLDRQSEHVRRLLLRTSLLERVNGDLADLLTGASGGERILQDLERAGAFVVARRGPVVVPLPPPVRRPAAAGTAPHPARRDHRAAPRRRAVVGRARISDGGGPPRPGRAGLGAGRPPAIGPLAGRIPQWAGCYLG
jgi:LuxR family transcriptional regulator, maltose regulon positive regulatory protein